MSIDNIKLITEAKSQIIPVVEVLYYLTYRYYMRESALMDKKRISNKFNVIVASIGKLKLRQGWKIVGAVIAALLIVGGYMVYANADGKVTMSLNTSTISVEGGATSIQLTASLRGGDDPAALNPDNIEWEVRNESVALFVKEGGTISTTTTGANPVIMGQNAGRTVVTGRYYQVDPDTGAKVELCNASATVVTKATITVTDGNGTPITDINTRVFEPGEKIRFKANTYSGNGLVVTQQDGNAPAAGVVKIVPEESTYDMVTVEVIGGGVTRLNVRTEDGLDANGNKIDLLNYAFTVNARIYLDESRTDQNGNVIIKEKDGIKYMVLDDTPYKPFTMEELPTNIKYPALSGALFRSENEKIATIKAGNIVGIRAGVTQVSAGVYGYDSAGNEVPFSVVKLKVVVPYKKLGNEITTMNVGDKTQLMTSDNDGTLWYTSDKDIVELDAATGEVKALKAGTATITATRSPSDDLSSIYDLPYELTYKITVIDGFGLSSNNLTVNVDETVTLEALVTSEDLEKNPVTFKVENQPREDGTVPTQDLVKVSQDGKKLSITGVQSGTVHITGTQTVNGVTKSAMCVVYVTNPVRDMYIDPSSITIERGKTDVVQLHFEPEGPTNSTVIWGSSNPEVATVEGDSYKATITAVSGGNATITVISQDGMKVANCSVYVREPVTGVTLNETSVNSTMAIGKFQLTATVTPDGDGVNRDVTWTSSNTEIIKVDKNGLVTFVKPGHATIICNVVDGGKNYQATCEFFISIPVEHIKLDTTKATLSVGDKLRISAEVLPVTASDKTLYWESSNTNICVVDSNGLVQAVGTGSCTILCKSADGGMTAMCEIFVKQPVTSIVLSTTDITVRKGQVFWLNGTCLPENADNKQLTWMSRDEDVCTVESDGKVTATGAGTTSIIATSVDSGVTAFCTVTVTQPVTGITLNSDYQLLWVGAKYAIIPIIEPADAENKNVTYLSSDPTVASVDENGIVTALKGGSCVIEVTTEECKLTAACTIEVKEYVSSIELSETYKYLNVGASGTLTAKVGAATATNKNITWSSSNNDICSVDSSGNIIGHTPGTAVITATAADGSGVSATCIVRVVNPVLSISVEPSTLHLLVGESKILKANIYPENASIKDVKWISSDEKIAVVDEAGEVFALSPGKVKITAQSTDGNEVKGVCWVYVTPVVDITSLKINSSEIYMLAGKSRQLSVRVRPAINTDSYDWYSSDTGTVIVDGKGLITTVGPGTAEVYVESNSKGVMSTCIVHSLGISKSSITLEQYDKFWLDVLGIEEGDKVRWRSSNPRVCTVSQSGEVVARKAGTTTVTAVTHNKTLTCTVRVTNFR